MFDVFDVIVIGGGHAAIEAALAPARMGFSALMITMDPAKIGQCHAIRLWGVQPKVRSSAISTPWAAKWGWYKNEGAAPGAA